MTPDFVLERVFEGNRGVTRFAVPLPPGHDMSLRGWLRIESWGGREDAQGASGNECLSNCHTKSRADAQIVLAWSPPHVACQHPS